MASIDERLLQVLACPAPHHAPVELKGESLVCTECGLAFPIRDGIPVMLLSEAVPAGTS